MAEAQTTAEQVARLAAILAAAHYNENGIAAISWEMVDAALVTLNDVQAELDAKDKRIAELKADVHNAGQRNDEMAAALPTWISASVVLPASGEYVLAWDGQHAIRAMHAKRFTESANPGGEEEATEYSDEMDGYFLLEGWYEHNEFEEIHWTVDRPVTHWMRLPVPPEVRNA